MMQQLGYSLVHQPTIIFPIGTPTHSHRETASAYIERHLNKQRQKPLREDERITLDLDVENLQNDP
jgi:hypothetical protein